MSKSLKNSNVDFERILLLIQEAKSRVYAKANAELVLLYFNVGKIVSEKVNAGNWGENTVQELAGFVASKQPELSGFSRRGLYRMKQFYEFYSPGSACFVLWLNIQNQFVSPTATQISTSENTETEKVSPTATQLQNIEINVINFHRQC